MGLVCIHTFTDRHNQRFEKIPGYNSNTHIFSLNFTHIFACLNVGKEMYLCIANCLDAAPVIPRTEGNVAAQNVIRMVGSGFMLLNIVKLCLCFYKHTQNTFELLPRMQLARNLNAMLSPNQWNILHLGYSHMLIVMLHRDTI